MKINSCIPLKDIELSLEGSRVLSICIFNRTPRKFLCLLANHCNRVLLNFCLFNLGDFCELVNFLLYFSVLLYIFQMSVIMCL